MGALEKSPVPSNSMQRVKVYRLNEDGKWDDQGTGHVTVDYLERSEELGLFVIDEEDNETLLLHRISLDDIYRKQEETIISWRDQEYSTELALSFQETAGCSYIWDHICSVQRNLHFSTLDNEAFHSVNSDLRELPVVELPTLPLILKIVTESGITDQMHVTELILRDEFFQKLMDLFGICEGLENIDSLHMIYKIVKGIILLNSQQIFEKIFGDDLIMNIIGCLEYDPEGPRVHHRNFLNEHVFYREAIPIKDRVVLSKIHQTYKIGYLKDVILPRVLDEATAATLNSMIHANNSIVVSLLKDDSTFIQELFARLRSPSTPAELNKNLVYFLHEFCTLSKSLQMVQQLRLFRDLVNEGIIDVIIDILQSDDKRLVLTGTDILILFLNQDLNLLRSYVIRPEGIPLLGLLVQGMLSDFGDDMHCQFLEILRSLLDSSTLSGPQCRETIVDIFYEKHLVQLIEVITASCAEGNVHGKSAGETSVRCSSTKPEILLNICELLSFCVLHHPYRIKCNSFLNNLDKVLLLTQRREGYLIVAAVRFVRTLVSRFDEQLGGSIIRNNLFKPIVDAFVANGNRYNLLNSAVLELFEYISRENLKPLVKYVVESFWNLLGKFENFPSIHSLKVKYDQYLENCEANTSNNVVDSRKQVDERALEKEEEDYFNEDSDEEETASASLSRAHRVQAQSALPNGSSASCQSLSSGSGGLVDYDDDDDDYKPPPRRQKDASDGDEGTLESLSLKRKIVTKEESSVVKRQRLDKSSKSKDGVFVAFCSPLSQAVLPNKKVASSAHKVSRRLDPKKSVEKDHQEKQDVSRNRSDECPSDHNKEIEKTACRNCSDGTDNISECRHSDVEESPLLPANSSSEMAVNGS